MPLYACDLHPYKYTPGRLNPSGLLILLTRAVPLYSNVYTYIHIRDELQHCTQRTLFLLLLRCIQPEAFVFSCACADAILLDFCIAAFFGSLCERDLYIYIYIRGQFLLYRRRATTLAHPLKAFCLAAYMGSRSTRIDHIVYT